MQRAGKMIVKRVKYMSSSRMKELHELQSALMKELVVPVMDIYEASYLSADWMRPGDGRHYRPELNFEMLGWFYQEPLNLTVRDFFES
jgi:hypothetical protein